MLTGYSYDIFGLPKQLELSSICNAVTRVNNVQWYPMANDVIRSTL